jgi:phosphatidylglycerol---prolipoprotein diacylglyceryl transferase
VFPYLEQPVWHVFGRDLGPFQLLVGVAALVGYGIAARRAARLGLDRSNASSLLVWTIAIGFVISHMVDVVFYRPELLRENPLELIRVPGSISSYGGMFGGIAAGWWLARRQGLGARDQLRFLDAVCWSFPFAWIFGRLGCALAHDHLGVASRHWLAVRFPAGPRFDLGLLELLYTLLFLAPLFWLLDRRLHPAGFWLGLFFLFYGPVRFVLDMLRTSDRRYTALGWTFGQFASVAATLGGALMLVQALRARIDPRFGRS